MPASFGVRIAGRRADTIGMRNCARQSSVATIRNWPWATARQARAGRQSMTTRSARRARLWRR
eukprot:scaffold451_cov365-Prasinococcus_capsulatus_cf.AAC.38